MGNEMDFIENFRAKMATDSIIYNGIILADSELHRFNVEGDSKDSINGWYVIYPDNIPSGAYGCWKRLQLILQWPH